MCDAFSSGPQSTPMRLPRSSRPHLTGDLKESAFFSWGEGVADARSAGFHSSPLTEFRMHQHARRPHINPVIPRPRFECRPVDTSVWRGPICGWHGRCMSRSTASSERSCRLGTLWHSFFMRSRQRTREDGKLFTNYFTWHNGGRERERERERV